MIKLVKQPPELKKKIFTPKQKKQINFKHGVLGENQAINYLKKKAYKILERNCSYRSFEIDIIAIDQSINELVFVEVKYRQNDDFGQPSLAVNSKKISSLIKVAQVYQKKHRFDMNYRFDIISILPNRINHLKNITW